MRVGLLGLHALLSDSDVAAFHAQYVRCGLHLTLPLIEFLSLSCDDIMDRIELLPIPAIRFDGGPVMASIIGSSFHQVVFHIYVGVPSREHQGSNHIVYRCSVFSAYRDIPAPPSPPPGSPRRNEDGSVA